MSASILYVGDNTHVIKVVGSGNATGLTDDAGTVQTDATVQLTALVDGRTGLAATGITLPLTMIHVGSGVYEASLPGNLGVVAGNLYFATIKALGSQGFDAEWTETLLAQKREG